MSFNKLPTFIVLAGWLIQPCWQPSADESMSFAQLTLKQSIDLAMHQSELLQMSAEDIKQARERMRQATGAILPNVKWNYSDIIQDTSGVDTGSGGVGGTLTKRSRDESKFVLHQPLFQGFKEFSARSGYKAEARGFEFKLERENIALVGEVAEAFFTVVLIEADKKNLNTLITLTKDRADELKQRVRLGKSRSSEVYSAESQLASYSAQLVAAEGLGISARDNLGFLIGRDVRNVLLVDETAMPSEVSDEKDVPMLIKNRSDVQALQEQVIARRYAVRVARSGYWPIADVGGNYYTYRTGFQKDIDWDVIFNLDVPIFQGGVVHSQSKEALSQLRQSELELDRLTRQVGTEIAQAQSHLNYAIRESKMLEDSFEKAKRSYTMQVKEYRLGLVNNLEVLAALNVMQEARDRLDRALLQSKLNWVRLQVTLEQKL